MTSNLISNWTSTAFGQVLRQPWEVTNQDKRIRFVWQDQIIETDVDKFGALIGDDVRIGANAVVAPGAILEVGSI